MHFIAGGISLAVGKRKKTLSGKFKASTCLFFAVVIVCTSALYKEVPKKLSNLALLSAAISMPEGTKEEILNKFLESQLSFKEVISENDKPLTNNKTTLKQQIQQADSSLKILSHINLLALSETPKDILEIKEATTKNLENAKKDGNILEKKFGSKDANNVFGLVQVKNVTTKNLDIKAELEKGTDLSIKNKQEPCVLIFHTHTTESYVMVDNGWYTKSYTTRSHDPSRNVARVGSEIADVLNAAGFSVIHDTTIHDLSYNGSYSRSRETVKAYLEKYPSIQVVLDVHRDAIYYSNGTRVKPTATIGDKKCAQIMIISGAEDGMVTNFPNWQHNLRFALALQSYAQEMFQGLMKPLYFSQRKYNMDLTKYSLLLEMGSDANTLEEAIYSGRLIGCAIAEMLENCLED